MTKVLLHGGYTKLEEEDNESFWKELSVDIPANATILLVYFAVREKNYSEKIREDTEAVKKTSKRDDIKFIIANEESFEAELAIADAVYFRGGSTQKLMYTLKHFSNLKERLLNKTVAGSSAGAYALSTFYPSHYTDEVLNGIGLIDKRVVCHFENPSMSPNNEALDKLESLGDDLELVLLRDYDWRLFNF